jgi:tetratricopeptide (TPR) repeat protein
MPLPFYFQESAYSNLEVDAPILIIGDRFGEKLASFKNLLAEKLSINLSKPIKIQTMANEGDNIHRTLQKIKKLERVPLIIIYIGSSDQSYEKVFHTKNIRRIQKNIELYKNDYIKTALMVLPELSKFIYWPSNYIELTAKVNKNVEKYSDNVYQLRTILNYRFYEYGLDEFFNMAKKRNSLIIPLTTPLNLKIPPKKSCYGSLSGNANEQLDRLKKLYLKKDFKAAFNLSNELALMNPSNAQILYLHGQVLFKLNKFSEAQKYNEFAIAYDCENNRGNPVYNAILRKIAKKHNISFLDYHQMLVDESANNYTFFDEVYPQDFYLEKIVDIISKKIKKRLRL